MSNQAKNLQKTKKIVFIALFCALSYVVSLCFPVKVSFLTLDLKDAVSAMCGLFFGPIAGVFCAVVVPFIEMITTSETGFYGLIMNILSSVTFVGVSTLIYKYKKKLVGAVLGLLVACVATVAVMLLANLTVTPFYMRVTTEQVIALIPKLILPFNAAKTVLNAGVAMLLYKPMSNVIKKSGALRYLGGEERNGANACGSLKRSLAVAVISALVIAGASVVIFVVLGGKFI